MQTFTLTRGNSPLILSMPHPGLEVPPEVAEDLNERGRQLEDTDWHMRELYAFAEERWRPTIIEAKLSRYVIDLNRDPSGVSLYPGQATTELVPTTTFDGAPIWRTPPSEAEVARRRTLYFQPYHDALASEIERVRLENGYCVLWDCHSIRSRIPRLFNGKLPVLNLGTNGGASCAKGVHDIAAEFVGSSNVSSAINGRFKGGWITRHYGRPHEHVHAIQMEIAMRAYLETEAPPWTFSEAKARKLTSPWLAHVIEVAIDEARDIHRGSTWT